MDFPADDLTAEYVNNQIKIEERPPRGSGKPCDIPRPNFTGAFGLEACRRFGTAWWSCPAAPVVLTSLTKNTVKTWLRGNIFALIGQTRDNLAGEFLRVACGVALLPLVFSEPVGGARSHDYRAEIFSDTPVRGFPPLDSPCIKPQFGAGSDLTLACGHSLINKGNNLLAIRSRGHSSSPSDGPQIALAFFAAPSTQRSLPALFPYARVLVPAPECVSCRPSSLLQFDGCLIPVIGPLTRCAPSLDLFRVQASLSAILRQLGFIQRCCFDDHRKLVTCSPSLWA